MRYDRFKYGRRFSFNFVDILFYPMIHSFLAFSLNMFEIQNYIMID